MKKLFIVTLTDKSNGVSFDIVASNLSIDGEDVYVFHEYDKINKFLLRYYDFKVTKVLDCYGK